MVGLGRAGRRARIREALDALEAAVAAAIGAAGRVREAAAAAHAEARLETVLRTEGIDAARADPSLAGALAASRMAAVIAAVEAVLRGETPISPDVAGGLVGRRSPSVGGDLTRRETDVLHLVGAGLSNQDIAGELRISVNTVRNHVQRVLAKLDAHSKLEAVAIAARHGLLGSDRERTGRTS
ncbi:MAG: response regulator transcription factor [Actinomycetes bacterium]